MTKKNIERLLLYLIIIIPILCISFNNELQVYATENKSNLDKEENLISSVEEEIVKDIEEKPILATELDLGDYESEMFAGDTQLLYITVIPVNADDQTLAYKSSNQEVAKVNGIGRITALKVGITTITVSCGDISENFTLTVSEKVEETETKVPVTDIEIGDHEDEFNVDESINLSATVLPIAATEQTITYKSSNPSIATVSSTGEVKGISAGGVTIYITAGDYTKQVQLTVKVATIKIEVNSTYVILKPEETFTLKSSIMPHDASSSAITYKSLDSNIASVSSNGTIEAINTGNTTIIVSNDDTSKAVTVIVNDYEEIESSLVSNDNIQKSSKSEYPLEVSVDAYEVISQDMLKYIYQNKETLTIKGPNYTIRINGEDIVNYHNEFYTGLDFKQEEKGISFVLNEGNNLCGPINIEFQDEKLQGRYLYLYNEAKEKYYLVNVDDMGQLKLDTAGNYMITEVKTSGFRINWIVVICVSFILLGLVIVYIVTKKKHWFW